MKPKVIDLGWCLAKLDFTRGQYVLRIFCPSNDADNMYTPPSDVVIYGIENIVTLRQALDEVLRQSTQNMKEE